MKIIILDTYKKTPYRVSKDTNGGYGVENDLGSGIVAWTLSRIAKYSIFWPPLAALNLVSEFHALGESVKYTQNINDVDSSIDYLFLSVSIVNSNHEYNSLISLLKKYPELKIFAFGAFLPFDKERFKQAGAAVIIGEPEFLAQQIKLSKSNLNLLFAQGEITIQANDPDKLAPAHWAKHIIANKNYILGNFSSFAPIIASRGCPYSCFEYCTYPLQQGRKVRSMSPEKVIEDINLINKDSGATNFVFRDPVFSINKNYTYSLLEAMSLKLNGFKFTVETHLNNIDDNMAERLKSASVEWVKFGIESSSKEVLDNVSRYSIAENEERKNIQILKSHKIKTNAMYIVCQPIDTFETTKKTIEYAIDLKTDLAQFSMFTPYPGTPYYEKVKDTELATKNFEDYTQFKLVYNHPIFSQKDARKILGDAYSKYYLSKLLF